MFTLNRNRRNFLNMAAISLAATRFDIFDSFLADTGAKNKDGENEVNPLTNQTTDSIKQINAGVLNVGYADAGPANGPVVILLHGWPYDIHSFDDVIPLLTAKGFRVIIPYLRGYGSTRFLSDNTLRNGQQSIFAVDTIALMDALKIDKAIVAGFDWGARTADILAAIWPQRCIALVSVSGYLIVNRISNAQPLPPKNELGWWYQYYFATERGRLGYEMYRHDFAKLIWTIASPKWKFEDAVFERSAASFNNPDHVAIVMHNYRWRLSLADGESTYDDIEKKLASQPAITIPAITIASDFDGAAADGKMYAAKFTGRYAHKILDGIGHNVPQEDPQSFANAILEVGRN